MLHQTQSNAAPSNAAPSNPAEEIIAKGMHAVYYIKERWAKYVDSIEWAY